MDEVLGREHPEPLEAVTLSLALEGITRRFGDHVAVDGVSFEIAPGELLALVGASGSGKTTTLRITAGYETADSGRILLGGDDISQLPPQKRGFGMVFQHYALFPHISVADNVAFGLEARGIGKAERHEKAEKTLASVGLGGAGKRGIQSLSGGEQQRVALARALIIEPRALLLDEPLSNLDPTLRQSTRDELRSMLHRVGVPALFVTHDQEDAFAIADRIALLKGGKLLQIGTPEDLYDRPVSRDVAGFIGRSTLVPVTVTGDTGTANLGGTLTFPIARNEKSGSAQLLAVFRPDSLSLVPVGGAEGRGVIVSRRFTGANASYQLRVDDGTVIEISSSDRSLKEGDEAGVRLARVPVPVVPA